MSAWQRGQRIRDKLARNLRANFFFVFAAMAAWGSAAAVTKALDGAGWWTVNWLGLAAAGLVAVVVNVLAERAVRGRLSAYTLIFSAVWAGIGLVVPLRVGIAWPHGVTVVGIGLPLCLATFWQRRFDKSNRNSNER